ncbi:poly-gamma-glutamate hydrolase family protein [Staphylococcus capitis]|uniref:poly-gamma-glutamate hydrolase family protein n=1 Tax=Staphylococcus capitis TaxID=29388 RepID=UPI001D02F1C4|nr:poly-gamma-glutamate hydrolase family protein [Staphylococcus capitis]
MKIIGLTRAFSFKKVTMGAVTALIGLGTIGATGNQAHASTHTSYSQSHRTTTNGKGTSSHSTVKTTTVKPKATSTKIVKPVHQTSKVQTTKKVVPTKQTTKSVKPVVTKAPTKQATSSKTSVTISKAPTTSTSKSTTSRSVAQPKFTSTVKSTSSTKPTAKTSTSRTSSTTKTTATKSTTTTKRTSSSSSSKSGTTTSRTTASSKSTATHKSTSTRTSSTKKSTTKPSNTKSNSTSTKPTSTTKKSTTTKSTTSTTKSTTSKTKPSTLTKQPTTTPTTTVPTTNQTDNNQEMIGTAPKGHIKDKYQSMTQLESETVEGVDWKKDTRDNGTKVLIVAPHGGNIEQGTTEATKALAKKGDYDYFSFEAIRPKNNTELHVTSTHYDDPTLNQMIKNRTATISIHGAAGANQIVYLGGPRSTLRNEIETQLKSSGFTVMVPPDYIGGVKKNNFINREENNTGVQLELTTALRKAFFNNGDTSTKSRSNESNWTPLMQTFVDALYKSINNIYPNN